MTSVLFEDSFDAAHWLPNVPENHKCRNMHGHTYRVQIQMTGPIGETTGWIMDYDAIRKAWNQVKCLLDHKILNETIPNPTCELIAQYIADGMGPWCSRIELRETVNCGAIWTR